MADQVKEIAQLKLKVEISRLAKIRRDRDKLADELRSVRDRLKQFGSPNVILPGNAIEAWAMHLSARMRELSASLVALDRMAAMQQDSAACTLASVVSLDNPPDR